MKNNKFNIGDKVSVIDETITGIITSVNGKIVQLKDENDFLYFYNINEIVLLGDNLYNNIHVSNKDKQKHVVKKNNVKNKKESILEVDLHIHQITHSNKYLSNTDMLLKQISHAKAKLDFAIKNNIQKIIFIHGKGQGVLKAELINVLKNYPVEIHDASFKKYGQGAMEVFIFKSKI